MKTNKKRSVNFCVYYESRKWELKRRLINEGRCDERLKAKVQEPTCLTYTGLHDKTNEKHIKEKKGQQTRSPRIRWSNTKSRRDGSPTDTQADTQSRSPRQDDSDRRFKLWRKRCAVEVTLVTVTLCELKSWNKIKSPNIDGTSTTSKSHTHPAPTITTSKSHTHPSHVPPTIKIFWKIVVYYDRIKKSRTKDKTYIWVSVWWKTKNEIWEIYKPRIHWVDQGTGTPTDKCYT
jgi:hypothetical protein